MTAWPIRKRTSTRFGSWLILCLLVSGVAAGDDVEPDAAESSSDDGDPTFLNASLRQPAPQPVAPIVIAPVAPRGQVLPISRKLFNGKQLSSQLLKRRRSRRAARVATTVVNGLGARVRSATDTGSLLGNSASAVGLGIQRRTPIVTDPRIRSTRVGSQNGAGSYWFPARIDLDTQLSKLDARIIDDVIVIRGPYSALYGPDLRFFDIEVSESPRFGEEYESYGSTSLEYRTNGEQWYGRQTILGGTDDWGYRIGYGHRSGSDYHSGDGVEIPSSYKSRDVDIAVGFDIDDDTQLELHYLRLDQTDVEFPGQAFDLDFLVTDGFEATVRRDNPAEQIDSVALDVWYNQTNFEGNTFRSGKLRQFPVFGFPPFDPIRAETDVDTFSTGYRLLTEWHCDVTGDWTLGSDLRYLKQELDERLNGTFGANTFVDRNSPIPRSHWSNPGLLVENEQVWDDRLTLRSGARFDVVSTDVEENAAQLGPLGGATNPATLAEILGDGDFSRDFLLASVFLTGSYQLDDALTLVFGAGRAERAPNLTELYAAESFMFLLQNGLNTVTGDPLLKKEQLWQVDLGLNWEYSRFRGSLNGFHAWIENGITFENMGINLLPPTGQDFQTRLKYVNTDLITMLGFEFFSEFDHSDWLTTFGTLSYVEADDRTRDGDFATEPFRGGGLPVIPSQRLPGLTRGTFGRAGRAKEALPGISPLESRLGLRLHDPHEQSRWAVEFSTRIVDNQDRVARSLFETATDGFTVWDLRTYWNPSDRWLLVAGVENITDKSYFEHLDFRARTGAAVFQPGRNFYFSVERFW